MIKTIGLFVLALVVSIVVTVGMISMGCSPMQWFLGNLVAGGILGWVTGKMGIDV